MCTTLVKSSWRSAHAGGHLTWTSPSGWTKMTKQSYRWLPNWVYLLFFTWIFFKKSDLHFAWWSLHLTVPFHISLCWATSFCPTHQVHNPLPAGTPEPWRSISRKPAAALPAIRAGRVGESLPLTLISALNNQQHCDSTKGLYKKRLLAVHVALPC